MDAESAKKLEEFERSRERLARNQELFDAPPHTLREAAVHSALRQTSSRTTWIDKADLTNAGHVGFENALRTFDPDALPPRPFQPYAMTCVRNEMRREANLKMPRSIRGHLVRISQAENELQQRLRGRREPTEDEIAAGAGVTVKTVRMVRRALPVIHAAQPTPFETNEWGSDGMSRDDVGADAFEIEEAKRAGDAEPIGGFSYAAENSGIKNDGVRSRRLPWELMAALKELSEGDRKVVQDIISGPSQDAPLTGQARQAKKRTIDKLFSSVIRKILDSRLSQTEQTTFAERYREGRLRHEPGRLEIATIRELRARLLANDLLARIFSTDALDVLTKRYERGWSIDRIAESKHWTANRCLAAEFAEMQKLVEHILPLDKKHEFRHAVLPDQLDVARCRFWLGQELGAIASDRGLTEDLVSAVLYATGETAMWLHTHPRYLNFGRHALTTETHRALLDQHFGQGTSPTQGELSAVSAILNITFNFEPQVQ